jgi:hypothetical protein
MNLYLLIFFSSNTLCHLQLIYHMRLEFNYKYQSKIHVFLLVKTCELRMDLRNITQLYMCENHATILPWLKSIPSTICIIFVSKFKHYYNSLNHGMYNLILKI